MRAIDHDAADLANTGAVVARNESDRCYLNEWPADPVSGLVFIGPMFPVSARPVNKSS